MTSKQERWLSGVIRKYEQEAARRYPMSDDDWQELQGSVSRLFEKCGRDPGVKDALARMLDRCDRRDRQERERMGRGVVQ